jgi:lysozyme
MTGRLRTSRAGLELIKSFEGFRDAAIRLPDGRWMIGYGHVRTAREGLKITEKDAEDLLAHDLKPVEDAVYGMVYAPLNQAQFDALVSLGFNIGPARLRDSDVIRNLNAGDFVSASKAFGVWRKARIHGRVMVVDALVRRRAAEKAMFLEHPAGRPSAPSPLVVPEADIEIGISEMTSPTQTDIPSAPAASSPASPLDMAEAVRRLAERTQGVVQNVPLAAAEPVSDEPEVSHPHTPPRTATEIEQAQRIVAERLARILERAERSVEHQPASQSARAAAAAPVRAATTPAPEPKSNGRAFIDDTETFNPGRDPAEIFAEAERNAKIVDVRVKRIGLFNGRVIALLPWVFIFVLSVLGFSIGLVETLGASAAEGALRSAPTILAVFGMLVLMSLYYLITRARADEA